MLMHYIEEVKGVQQVLDQEEEIAMNEFAKFEEKLRAQKVMPPWLRPVVRERLTLPYETHV